MFAINHAATALLIKRRFPAVPMLWLLLSVQLVELLWVLLNFLGVERTATEPVVHSVRDIHLAHMPYSHSVASTLALALLAWLVISRGLKRPTLAVAVALGIGSHLALDVLTHGRDIALAPWVAAGKIGLGLYEIPLAAFFVETGYGLLCWWIYGGGRALLATILIFNLANLSFFVPAIAGPEILMAGRPGWLVAAVALQIAITLSLVGVFSRAARSGPGRL
jgi:hypothetical protein